jgi:hypothetical protein
MHERTLQDPVLTPVNIQQAGDNNCLEEVREIVKDGLVLARHVRPGAFKKGLAFYSGNEEFLQVGTWHYDKGQQLRAHVHNVVQREINRTHEAVVVVKGSMTVRIFDEERTLVETITVREGEILIVMNGGHDYTILEDDTRILEIKNGPFLGRDIDKTLF